MTFWQRLMGNKDQDTHHLHKLMQSLLAMAWFVEARDPYTAGHMWRVSRYAKLLAEASNVSTLDIARISLGGFLHDIGKISTPDAILRKPGALTDEEYSIIKNHPGVGLRMLAGHPLASLVEEAIGKHHERPDGHGYPNGLSAEQIPLDALIVSLCDAFDAMTSHRPYRAGMPVEKALQIIADNADKQFDAVLTERFIELGTKGAFEHIMGHSDDGIPLQDCPTCGPTLAIRKEQQVNELIFCPNCTGEFRLNKTPKGSLCALPTGQKGSAKDLQPEADNALIARTVHSLVDAIPPEDLAALTLI
jgi:putative nucleotidyltransferase with HDIG domain